MVYEGRYLLCVLLCSTVYCFTLLGSRISSGISLLSNRQDRLSISCSKDDSNKQIDGSTSSDAVYSDATNPVTLVEETSSDNNSNSAKDVYLPRLGMHIKSLYKWVEKANGYANVTINQNTDGWTISTDRDVGVDETIIAIPRKVCIFADPTRFETPLLENAQKLMNSLNVKQWRARLAIALLSERVRPRSPYKAYIRNLPYEFWGVPCFYSRFEFQLLQDLPLTKRIQDRCIFLGDFSSNVVTPLYQSTLDPFSGHKADMNAFGWGFATAASRTIRDVEVVGENGQVMIPIIDIASHSFTPNCKIVNNGTYFLLQANRPIHANEEITINYGPLSNDELLEDYGFTMDDNPYNKMQLCFDATLLNTARVCMGQTTSLSEDVVTTATVSGASDQIQLGRGGNTLIDRWLHQWQIQWLKALKMYGSNGDYAVTIGSDPSGYAAIDGRLWAYLRILYSNSEDDLTKHGYDPYLLQNPGSMISSRNEAQVLKTLIGMLAIMLRFFGTDLYKDVYALEDNTVSYLTSISFTSSGSQIDSEDILGDAKKILRSIFSVKPSASHPSPTIRRALTAATAAAAATIGSRYHVNSYGSDDATDDGDADSESDGTSDNADAQATKLSVNMKEILKYRIRKKQSIIDLIKKLMSSYEMLCAIDELPNDIELSLEGRSVHKEDRVHKIRELLDNVSSNTDADSSDDSNSSSSSDSKDQELLAIAARVSAEWSSSNLSL